MSLRSPSLFLLLLVAAGCSSPGIEGADFGTTSAYSGGFPSQTFEGIVHASSSFGSDGNELGIDMLEENHIVPVALQVSLRGEGQDTAHIQAILSSMNLRLFLPDGTCLHSMSTDEVVSHFSRDRASELRKRAFRGDLLSVTPLTGYVFFALEPAADFEVSGRTVKHLNGGVIRTMDVANSLLVFDLEVNSLSQPFFVGLQR